MMSLCWLVLHMPWWMVSSAPSMQVTTCHPAAQVELSWDLWVQMNVELGIFFQHVQLFARTVSMVPCGIEIASDGRKSNRPCHDTLSFRRG